MQKIHRFITLLTLLTFLISAANTQSPPFTDSSSLLSSQRYNQHTFPLTAYATNDIVSLKLDITAGHQLTSTSMIASLDSPISFADIQLDQFYSENPADVLECDLDSMWNAKKPQIINLRKNTQSTLYVTVFNFDPNYRQTAVSYTITVNAQRSNNFCAPCENNGTASSSCFCTNCPVQYTGKLCTRLIVQLSKNTSVTLDPWIYQYFSISGTDRINVQITIQGGVAQAYFQFQSFSGEVANFYNVAKGSNDARYPISNSLKLGADTQQRKFLITLVSISGVRINASISYSIESSVSILVIVMSVLGGVLLIALIVAVVCIIKRRGASMNRVNSELNIPSQTNKLTGEQIQRYFPCCNYSQLNNMAQSSMNPLNTNNQVNKQKQGGTNDQDCVICLEQINQGDLVRIGYCKHIFHGPCLVSWFKKQRNCPYCRKQYSREDTMAEYNRLVGENGNRVLKDVELAQAVYNSKPQVQSKTLVQNIQ